MNRIPFVVILATLTGANCSSTNNLGGACTLTSNCVSGAFCVSGVCSASPCGTCPADQVCSPNNTCVAPTPTQNSPAPTPTTTTTTTQPTGPAPVGSGTLTLDPISTTVAAGSSTTTSLTFTAASGASGPIQLALQATPTGLTVTFPTLSATSASGSVSFAATGSMDPNVYSLTITATQNSATATAPFSLTVSPAPPPPPAATVTVQNSSGVAQSGVLAEIVSNGGVTQQATTNASGIASFSTAVTTPYTVKLVLRSPAAATNPFWGYVIDGLTTTTPVLTVPALEELFPVVPPPACTNQAIAVTLPVADEPLSNIEFISDGSGGYQPFYNSGTLAGPSGCVPSGSTSLFAIAYDNGGTGETSSLFASGTANSPNSVTTTVINGSQNMATTLTVPALPPTIWTNYSLQVGGGPLLHLMTNPNGYQTTATTEFQFPFATLAAFNGQPLSFLMQVTATYTDSVQIFYNIPATSTVQTLSLPNALTGFTPAPGATGVTVTTPFTWSMSTPATPAINVIQFFQPARIPSGATTYSPFTIVCVTAGASCSTMNFSDMDSAFAFPSSQNMTISIYQYFNLANSLASYLTQTPPGQASWSVSYRAVTTL